MGSAQGAIIERGTAYFRVAPAWIAALARTRVVEGNWRSGDRILECLEGADGQPMPLDLRYKILAGEWTLEGEDNAPEAVPWTDAEAQRAHREQCAWLWAGTALVRDRLWRPYAIVDRGHNIQDAKYASGLVNNVKEDRPNPDWFKARALYYADSPQADVAWSPNKDAPFILWRVVADMMPPWMHPAETFADAWTAYPKSRPLESRGAHDPTMPSQQAPAPQPRRQTPQPEDVAAKRRAQEARAAQEAEEDLRRAAEDAARYADRRRRIIEAAEGKPVVRLEWGDNAAAVPRALLAALAVSRSRGDSRPDNNPWDLWRPICPGGLKMPMDDPWHSDLMHLLGVDLQADYGPQASADAGAARRAVIYEATDDLQRLGRQDRAVLPAWVQLDTPLTYRFDPDAGVVRDGVLFPGAVAAPAAALPKGTHRAVVLCGTGTARGPVVHAEPDQEVPPGSIVVVPNAGVDYYIAAVTAHRAGGAVIAEDGGVLTHLAVEGREAGFRVLVLPKARTLLPAGVQVVVDATARTVRVLGD